MCVWQCVVSAEVPEPTACKSKSRSRRVHVTDFLNDQIWAHIPSFSSSRPLSRPYALKLGPSATTEIPIRLRKDVMDFSKTRAMHNLTEILSHPPYEDLFYLTKLRSCVLS
jgi:hypothetical protein